MRDKLNNLKATIDKANKLPIYAVGAKVELAEKAVNSSYNLIEELVNRIERLEDEA